MVLYAATFTNLSLTALRWHSVAVESRTLPECQYQPLFNNYKKCQMPLALSAGTLTKYHSHCHGNNENLKLLKLFGLWIRRHSLLWLGAPPVSFTSSSLELGWKLLHQKCRNAASRLSLLTRSRCHLVKCIVWVFWASGGFFWVG